MINLKVTKEIESKFGVSFKPKYIVEMTSLEMIKNILLFVKKTINAIYNKNYERVN